MLLIALNGYFWPLQYHKLSHVTFIYKFCRFEFALLSFNYI